MALSINELYMQYEACIALQSDIISACRRDLESLRQQRKHIEYAKLSRYLNMLYDEKNELMSSAHELRKYIEATQKKSETNIKSLKQ